MTFTQPYFLFDLLLKSFIQSMSILKQSANLTNHSLESFIIELTESSRAHQLPQLKLHPKIGTLSADASRIWKTLCLETYKSAKEKSLLDGLKQKQVNSLRKLSVLNLFQQKNSVPISVICGELDVQKIALYKLLTEMSSKELISIKIDDRSGICHILASKRRQQLLAQEEDLSAECLQRLNKVLRQNVKLVENLSRTRVD